MTKLKPCPFCGGQAVLDKVDDYHNWQIKCTGRCRCMSIWYKDKNLAIARWNNRASGWIPFEFSYDNEKEMHVLQGELPKEGQEILVSNGRSVWTDTFLMDGEECYLDSGLLIVDSAIAWQPLPEPYHIGEITEMVDSAEIGG